MISMPSGAPMHSTRLQFRPMDVRERIRGCTLAKLDSTSIFDHTSTAMSCDYLQKVTFSVAALLSECGTLSFEQDECW